MGVAPHPEHRWLALCHLTGQKSKIKTSQGSSRLNPNLTRRVNRGSEFRQLAPDLTEHPGWAGQEGEIEDTGSGEAPGPQSQSSKSG